jgi:hypothetical protein
MNIYKGYFRMHNVFRYRYKKTDALKEEHYNPEGWFCYNQEVQ